MFCVVASEYVPVAVYCRVLPGLIPPLAGVTEIAVKFAAVTVMVVDPVTPAKDAVIVTPTPGATPVANPSLPGLLLMAATAEFADPQLTCVVKTCVVASE